MLIVSFVRFAAQFDSNCEFFAASSEAFNPINEKQTKPLINKVFKEPFVDELNIMVGNTCNQYIMGNYILMIV